MKRIRLAIVDDSSFMRKALARLLSEEPRLKIVGAAASGEELLQNIDQWNPDVVTLDLSMPGMGGLATLEHILRWRRIPVLILSTHSAKDAPMTIEALHCGAVEFIDKQQFSLVDFQALRDVLLEKIFSVTLGGTVRAAPPHELSITKFYTTAPASEPVTVPGGFEVLLIGASTGGPPALQQILESFGGPPPVPVVIVQHMPLGFTRAFAERLNAHLPMPVREASHNELCLPGTVYIGPSGSHVRIKTASGRMCTVLTRYPEEVQHHPSVDVLFESAVPLGQRALAVLLTGMGKDGAGGMSMLHAAGATTIVQDESSCVVFGMPKAAIQLEAVDEAVSLTFMGPRLGRLLGMGRP